MEKFVQKGGVLVRLTEQDESDKNIYWITSALRTLGLFDSSKTEISASTNSEGAPIVIVKMREKEIYSEDLVKLSKKVFGFSISTEYNGGKSWLVFEFLID